MFVLRPSSPFRSAKPAKAVEATTVEVQPKAAPPVPPTEPYIDEGLPIPDSYDVDIIRAMLQDPFRLFIYWEVREESISALTRYFSPEEASQFRVVLKLYEIAGRNEAYFDVDHRGRYWMMVFPDRDYEFEIGVHSPVHGYIMLVRSNRVHTPRGTIAPEPAPEPEYRLEPGEFSQIIADSGFAADQALDMTLAAAAGTVPDQESLESLWDHLPESLQTAIPLAARGDGLTYEMIMQLPEPLRSELLKLFEGSGGQIASIGLMHYLPELLREIIDDESEWIGDRLHPMHITPKFFLGASEEFSWPGEKLRLPGLPQRPSSEARLQKPDVKSGSGIRSRLPE